MGSEGEKRKIKIKPEGQEKRRMVRGCCRILLPQGYEHPAARLRCSPKSSPGQGGKKKRNKRGERQEVTWMFPAGSPSCQSRERGEEEPEPSRPFPLPGPAAAPSPGQDFAFLFPHKLNFFFFF